MIIKAERPKVKAKFRSGFSSWASLSLLLGANQIRLFTMRSYGALIVDLPILPTRRPDGTSIAIGVL